MSIIAGALYIVKSCVGYKRSFEHDSLELSTEDVEGWCSTKWWRQSVPGTFIFCSLFSVVSRYCKL